MEFIKTIERQAEIEASMRKIMDGYAIGEGKKTLFRKLFSDWHWKFLGKNLPREEFDRAILEFSEVPGDVTINFLRKYFKERLDKAYGEYMGGSEGETDE